VKKELDYAFLFLPQLTKEEADFLLQACQWTDVQRAAFIIAKQLFEENDDVLDQD